MTNKERTGNVNFLIEKLVPSKRALEREREKESLIPNELTVLAELQELFVSDSRPGFYWKNLS